MASRWRHWSFRALALLFAVSWVTFPGWAGPDLIASWSPDWPQVLEGGWGVFSAVIVGVPFLALTLGRWSRAALVQLALAASAYAVSAGAGHEPRLLWLGAGLALETALVSPLARGGAPIAIAPTKPLLVLGAAGASAWIVYALDMWSANRSDANPPDVTMGIDHYAVQGALALVLACLPLLAGLSRELRPLLSVCAGVAGAYLGLVSATATATEARLGLGWAIAAIAWGTAVAIAGRRSRIGEPRLDGSRSVDSAVG
jgi:hypothetical protein